MKSDMDRRTFLKAGTATGLTAARVFASPSAVGANDRITFGAIGVGGMGTGHVNSLVKRSETDNIRCAAVCDVYQRRVTRAVAACNGDGYTDYRRLLERRDVDAVLIATPDHWHGKISIDALDADKHVYVEKPMTHTVEQAIQLRNAARKSKKVVQVGPQATGDDAFWQAHEAIKEGRIGKVTWAHGTYNRNYHVCLFNEHQKIDPTAGPDQSGEDHIDWDMWLGHKWGLAPKIPWTPDHFFRFRKYWPYSGGVATDLLYHKLAPFLLSIVGPNGEYPRHVTANGGLYVEKDGRDIPDMFLMTIDYPSEYTICLVSTLTNDTQLPDRIYGKFGTMDIGGESLLKANGEYTEEFKGKNGGSAEATLPHQQRRDQVGNFIDVIRGNGQLNCNAELGAATMVAIAMGVDAYRQRKTLTWDANKERVVK